MVLGTSASIQIAAAIAHGLFDTLTPMGVSALRFALGAAIIVPAVRPAIRGRDRETWLAVAVYGVSLGVLNVTFFASFQRLPLGLAVTFAFVAPLCVALAGSRRRRDVAFALLAGAGVVVLGGIERPGSAAGVALAVAAGCAWVAVAFAGRTVGRRTRRIDGLALAIPIACLVTLPLGISHVRALDARALALGLLIAVGGMILPFALRARGAAPAGAAHGGGDLQRRPGDRRRDRRRRALGEPDAAPDGRHRGGHRCQLRGDDGRAGGRAESAVGALGGRGRLAVGAHFATDQVGVRPRGMGQLEGEELEGQGSGDQRLGDARRRWQPQRFAEHDRRDADDAERRVEVRSRSAASGPPPGSSATRTSAVEPASHPAR